MYEKDWRQFLAGGAGNEIAIAQVSQAIVAHLGSESEKVYLHHAYARKSVDKHQLTPASFPLIFDTVERGTAIADRVAHVTFFHKDPDSGKWFQVTIKRSRENDRLYLATFHRVKEREVRRRLRKHSPLEQ